MEALQGFLPLILFLVVFYFFLIRPQQKHQKMRKEMIASLKKGDKIVTIGGIIGTIKELREEDMTVRLGDNLDIKMMKYSVDRVTNEEGQ
ncbi:MAG TPA: preprotein translocase subunit YajC [Firmicutes bacterium]|nr:preprotein translocase subunit YajC [Bacillota bacterium]